MFPISETSINNAAIEQNSKDVKTVQSNSCSFWNQNNEINIDGVIDDYKQGKTGNCWLLEGLDALSNTPEGAKCIKDSIKKNFFGGVTVTLKGVNKSYIIMPSDIKEAKNLSSGDDDVKVIELAVERYRKEQIIEKMNLKNSDKGGFSGMQDFRKSLKIKTGDGTLASPTNGGSLGELMYLMTGKKPVEVYAEKSKNLKSLSDIENPGICPMAISFKNDVNSAIVAKHAYAVIASDENYTTLVNPWDNSKHIKVKTSLVLSNFDKAEYIDFLDKPKESKPEFI